MSDFRDLVAGLHDLVPDDRRAALVALLRGFNGSRVRINGDELARVEREREALRLLQAGRERAAIVRRLVHAHGVSRQTARRDVAAALDARRPDKAQA